MDTPHFQPNRLGQLLFLIAAGGLFYVIGQYVASAPQRVAQEQDAQREITVQGSAEVQARPDVAQFTLGVDTGVQANAERAMELLTTRFTAISQSLQDNGIKEEDIKTTNLSIQPMYDYQDGRQVLRGFQASESVVVKIRQLEKIGDVLARATGEGVNQAGGISFEIDDPSALQAQAEEEAIADAQEKARTLARALDVRLGSVKSFSASNSNVPPLPMPYLERASLDSAAADKAISGPPVPSGSNTITATVHVTYELQ